MGWSELIAPGAALAGVAVGKFWDRLGDRERWGRDRRSDAFAAFAAAAEGLYSQYAQEAEDFDLAAADAASDELTRAIGGVDLFAGDATGDAATALWKYAVTDLTPRSVMAMSEAEWASASTKYRKLVQAFLDAARTDLGLPVRVWRRIAPATPAPTSSGNQTHEA